MFNSSVAGPQLLAAVGILALSLASTVASAASSPYSGAPVAIPNTIQAENFDKGGEGFGYHDSTTANAGGKYRTSEGVDIITSTDSGGGYVVNYFQNGEWLAYTIRAASAGAYDVDLRAASTYTNSAFHIELDGQNLTGRVAVPGTGSWDTFQWLGKQRLNLPAGQHVLKIVADQEYFNLNSIRVAAAPAATPYSGTAAAIPGVIEAENFDNGGEGVAYHDGSYGNTSGQYRSGENVDSIALAEASGGVAVNNFQTGEWLAYSINVATAGNYDLELRAATAYTGTAFHIELDGVAVTGRVEAPTTGNWNAFQWLGKQRLSLAAGKHSLKVVSDQEYFDLDAIRLSAPDTSSARQLFGSSFEGTALNIVPPVECWATGCWGDFLGLDSLTSFTWPGNVWGGGGRFLLLTDPVVITPLTVGNYLFNRLETVAGHNGNQTRALLQQITQNANGSAPMGTSPEQNEFQFLPPAESGDLYVSYWMKLQPDLVQKMTNLPAGPGISNGGTWRAIFALKTGNQASWGGPADDGDYRIEAYVMTYGNGQPYWAILGDNNAGGGAPLVNNWSAENRTVPVPIGQWFKFEIFWHRSAGSDGRVWMAANGQTLADHRGPNMGARNLPINRIMAPMLYGGGAMPIYQWIDDLEVWNGFPPASGSNPPYAAH